MVCPEGQWRCVSGQCIDPLLRCDNKVDCTDGSDEFYAGCVTPRKSTAVF